MWRDALLAAVLLEPKTIKKPKELVETNGSTRQDPYYWLRDDDREDVEVLQHLKVCLIAKPLTK
jgi:oligopeptidase B